MKAALWKRCFSALAVLFALFALGSEALAQGVPPRPGRAREYKVRIDSAPQQASIHVEHIDSGAKSNGPVGITPWDGKLVRGQWKIILKKEGYEDAERIIDVRRTREIQTSFIPLVKKEVPASIDVRADADKNSFNAEVWVDGQVQGNIPVIINVSEGRHLVEIRKDGHETFSQWIQAKEGERVTMNPVLKAVAVAKKGSILVEADVTGAEVFIDGNPHPDPTPTIISDVLEGPHIIEVRKEPAIPWKQTINVVAGQTAKVSAELKATIGGPVGTVRVLSNIEGARVYLDGTDLGPVPLDIKDVKPGEHVVEVKAEGYLPREERITVNAGSAAVLKLDLQPVASKEQTGVVKVVSPVPEALVFIDGESVGSVPQERELPPGEHFVVVQKPGYKKFEQKLNLQPGQTMTVTAELAAVGMLRVLSSPAGADVVLNGEKIGTTPFNGEDIDAGEHVVTVRMSQFYESEQRIVVEGGKRTIVSAKLEPINLGPTPDELEQEQRGLSSFGAKAIPLGRATVDFASGYPYFLDGQITAGAGKLGGQFPFDAGFFLRSFLSRSELGARVRLTLADREPFSFGIFASAAVGSNLIDDSGRNSVSADFGGMLSLTAFGSLTLTGRAYVNTWSDRHCPATTADGEEPLAVCASDPAMDERLQQLGFESTAELIERENGARVVVSAIAELALWQRWSIWMLLEGAPLQDERAAFTTRFNQAMFEEDIGTYVRLGGTFKF